MGIISLLSILLVIPVYAEQFKIEVPNLIHKQEFGEHKFRMNDYGSTLDIYKPQLPTKTYYYEVPPDTKKVKVNLKRIKSSSIYGVDDVRESLPPMPANRDSTYRPPKRKSHDLNVYPEERYVYNGIKVRNGRHLASITIFPVRYYFNQDKIEHTTEYVFSIDYPGKAEFQGFQITQAASSEPPLIEPLTFGTSLGSGLKYVIITTDALDSYLEPLADWKTAKGTPAKVYSVTDIYANYSGYDNAEEIHMFLRDMESAHDIDWVLLGGDHADVPARMATVPDNYSGDGVLVPTDYYYADLAGNYSPYNWDYDNDSNYGEVADNVDWLPDAYVGRLSTSNTGQMSTMVDNIINYEKNPASGSWTNKIILAGGESDASTDEAKLMDFVRTDFLIGYMTSERVYYLTNYARDYSLSFANFEARADNGASLVNWAGHGGYTLATVSKTGPSFVSTSTSPTNDDKRPFVYANSCNTGGFDQASSLGEDIIRDWGIGFVGASRVSWYVVGWDGPWDPMNQAHDYRFFEQMLNKSKYRPGEAFYDSKVDYISDFSTFYHPDDNLYSRKNLMAYNLLGDPELEIWTEVPQNISISYDDSFQINSDNTLTVTVTSSGSPVASALVCMQNDEIYETGSTDGSGEVTFSGVHPTTSDPLTITASKHNYRPAQGNMTAGNVTINLISPIAQEYINPDKIDFSFNVTASSNISICSLKIDNSTKNSSSSITLGATQTLSWTYPTGGELTWTIDCTADDSSTGQASNTVSVILMNNFDGNSTNLSAVPDIENITNLVAERSNFGRINFTDSVNLSGGADLNQYVQIKDNHIKVDSENLPALNTSATLTIYNVNFGQNLVIMRNSQVCTDCLIEEIGPDYVTFNVSHFTTYSVTGAITQVLGSGKLTETSAEQEDAQGGNVTEINLTATVSTDRWQGYYGNVSGKLRFGRGSYIFYTFGVSSEVAVYASQNSSFDFTAIEAAAASDIDTQWGYGVGNDQAEDIFTGDTTNISGVVAPSVELLPLGQNLNSTIMDDGQTGDKLNYIFGAVVQKGATCFDSSICDYELLVPADGTEQYYFFLEVG